MAYVVPQVQVFQEFKQASQAGLQQLFAFVSGGHAKLLRYAEASEKALALLGNYDHEQDASYEWPERPAGGIVDASYTRIRIDDALLKYFHEAAGSSSGVTTIDGSTNRVTAAALSFRSNGASYPRGAAFLDRDVKIGDVVRLRATVGGDLLELCTHVAGFVAATIAPTVTGTSADAHNPGTQIAAYSAAAAPVAGDINCVEISAHTNGYVGLASGHLSEVYTVLVTEPSIAGDFTAARLRVTSSSGTDDQTDLAPAAAGVQFAIGTQGLQIAFDVVTGDCEDSAAANDVAVGELLTGQTWEISVAQAYTANIVTGDNDSYTGLVDDVYILEVTKGGKTDAVSDADKPRITVRTVRGSDASGPTMVTQTNKSAFPVGTRGTTVAFSSSNVQFVKGAKYYVPVTGAGAGAMKTLILGHSLPQDLIDAGATDVELTLFIRKDIEVGRERVGEAPLLNWDQSSTEIAIKSGIEAFDASWTDEGEPIALPVETGCSYSKVYVEARYWLPTLSASVWSIDDVGELDNLISGSLHPDNELKWGVFKALQNSGGAAVKFTAVCDPNDVDQWQTVIDLIDGRGDVYGLVPLTRNPTVWSLFQAHVEAQSSPSLNRWRVLWINQNLIEEIPVVDATSSSDEDVVLAMLEDDPLTSGTQYTQLRVTSGNVDFDDAGVRAGDVVRYLFGDDGFGTPRYDEFVVDEVINNDTLRLQTGNSVAISVAEKIEVWRTLSAVEQAEQLALAAGFNDRRVRMVWPDEIDSDGYVTPGYFLCAALAGLSSGVVPQQGLTRLEINGFTNASRTVDMFSRANLNTMAEGGVWIVTQSLDTGKIYSRHAITTGDNEVITDREEMIVRNSDAISYYFASLYDPYIGVSNTSSAVIDRMRAETRGGIKYLESANFVDRLGPQLVSGTLVDLRQHAVLKDRTVVIIDLTLPAPNNNVDVHLQMQV